jgi:hypothetical protein
MSPYQLQVVNNFSKKSLKISQNGPIVIFPVFKRSFCYCRANYRSGEASEVRDD